jgi:hypothetical protein
MQRESTIKFWDDFYVAQQKEQEQLGEAPQEEDETATTRLPSNRSRNSYHHDLCKEWILQPSPALLEELAKYITSLVSNRQNHCLLDKEDSTREDVTRLIVVRILEIGSGTSCLARELCRYLNNNNNSNNNTAKPWNTFCYRTTTVEFHVLATDVSHVCIEQNRQRDAPFILSSTSSRSSSSSSPSLLQYQVLNVVQGGGDSPAAELAGKFDVILDKGCLDTFLFRSRTRGSGPKRDYSPLVRTVLDNVHTWLATGNSNEHDGNSNDTSTPPTATSGGGGGGGGGGVYLILSPRSKLKCVRDYRGFASVERHLLDLTKLDRGDLENSSNRTGNDCNKNTSKERVFLYQCHKNPRYSPTTIAASPRGEDNRDINARFADASYSAFSRNNNNNTGRILATTDSNGTTCPKCQMSLVDFFKNKTRGNKIAWTRKFQGHIQHCKG